MTLNMACLILLPLFFAIFHNNRALGQSEKDTTIPQVNGSYIAVGEIVMKISGIGYKSQVKFDETYDSKTGNAAFTFQEVGINMTFIEDASTKQIFQYSSDGCTVMTAKEWIAVSAPPNLMAYEIDDGKAKFSLKQLFNVTVAKYLVHEGAGNATTYRGLPARSWLFRIEPKVEENGNKTVIDIYAYWSDGSWKSTSTFGQQIPLGFTVRMMVHDRANNKMFHSEQYINIYSFIHDAFDSKPFEPRQGIQCPGRNSLFAFPLLAQNAQAITFRSEVVFPDEGEIKTMDVWYDMKNGFHRVDLNRIYKQNPLLKTRIYTSDITSKTLDTTYYIDVARGVLTCAVKPTSEFDWDYQEIINPKLDLKLWNMRTLFALDTTNYTYIGKTTKRNIPCHLFQGVREDWPVADVRIESLWEWCIIANIGTESDFETVNSIDGNIGLVSAQITYSQKNLESKLKITEKEVATIIHHFYDVKEEDPINFEFSAFDISRCFTPEQQRRVEFSVDLKIDDENLEKIEKVTSDTKFLSAWKTAISEKSKLALNTLRLTKVKSMVWGGNLLVSFTVLGVHTKLAENAKQNKPSLEEAITNLNDSIKAGQLQIKFAWAKDKEPETLMASKDSLKDIIIKPSKIPTISSPVPTESTTNGIIFSLKTPSEFSTDGGSTDDGKTSTDVPDGGSTATKTPDGASTSTRVPDGASTSAKIPAGESTTTRVPDGASTSAKTPDGASTSTRVPDGTSTSAKTPDGASTSAKTPDGASTSAKTPDGASTTTRVPDGTSTEPPLTKKVFKGHSSGAVAGVSIAMLVVGISLGAGGTFFKLRIMPRH